MAHLPGKLHICQVIFDMFARKISHFPGSKRAHMPGIQKYIFRKCPKQSKRPNNYGTIPEIAKKGQKEGGHSISASIHNQQEI